MSTLYSEWAIDTDSSNSSNDSSDDGVEELITTALSRHRNKKKKGKTTQESKNELDDFEKEMEKCLQVKMDSMNTPEGNGESGKAKYYSKEYFDSDEDDNVSGHLELSNAELLYDPHMDDQDEKWINKQRDRYLGRENLKQNESTGKKNRQAPSRYQSDAVLNCPACMVTLCRDCQRHDRYHHQYRAMFVSHCSVDYKTKLSIDTKNAKLSNKNRKRKKNNKFNQPETSSTSVSQSETSSTSTIQPDTSSTHVSQSGASVVQTDQSQDSNIYHPVYCDQCRTEVAVYDSDEVYHFFNVLTAH